ncbi:MAG: molybdopterin-dependent oxidoreductase [Deltaproteobacteria bacterium]
MTRSLTRRDFIKAVGGITATAVSGGLEAGVFADEKKRMFRFPEKDELVLLTSRPPNLETPLHLFKETVTPNKSLFVRWHLANIPTSIDLKEWRLKVGGHTEKELLLSMDELRRFERVTYTAVIQCAGNGRSFFDPRIPGAQWGHGAMGNVTWTGVRLRDILNRAGIKAGAADVSFNGLDSGTFPTTPDFVRSLPADKAMEEDIMVAYEMNGEPLLLLNGYPARLVVPGWYAACWIKALREISVLPKRFEGFWMDIAYRIPDNPCACVPPGSIPQKTIPIHRMNTRSLILEPEDGARLSLKKPVRMMGIAFSGGFSIKDVIVSVDGGRDWREGTLGRDEGRYSWVQWFYSWLPSRPGRYELMARATNSIGESQPLESLWNPAGYRWNKIEKIGVTVE